MSIEAGAVSNARYSRIRKTIEMRVRWPRYAILPKLYFLQVVATRAIQPGAEILAPYGVGFARRVRKIMKDMINEVRKKEREFEEAHFYRARGPVPRWHCKRCKRFVPTTKKKDYVIVLKE